mgnify:CR=1 FL=1
MASVRRWAFYCALLAAPLPALGTVLLDWGVDELARRSDLIVIGTVESKNTVAVDRTLMTDTRVRVERTLAGEPTQIVTVRQLGGQLGKRIVDLPGDAVLETGRKYLLFTAKHDGHTYLVGMALGALRVENKSLTQTISVPILSREGTMREERAPRTTNIRAIERAILGVKK